MWFFWIIAITNVYSILGDISSAFYCADLNPQPHTNIEQLMGMWYGIEIITHSPEKEYYTRIIPSCPIIHLSEDQSTSSTTYNPLYKGYDYGYNYGEKRDNNNPQNQQRKIHYGRNEQYPRYKQIPSQERTLPSYNRDDYNLKRYGNNGYIKRYPEDIKKLRLWWDENGSGTEYNLRYNVTRPGFWISSGPQNGSELEPQFSHFAGTVQVIKAVGHHLVLTFCHQLPDRQLFTILLSRENRLENIDIHGVHTLLVRKGLSTNNIKKVCTSGSFGIFEASILIISSSVISIININL